MLGRENIIKVLKPFVYSPDPLSPNLWAHHTRPITFCLCVDDFGVKYYTADALNHLFMALISTFTISVDDNGKKYCGLTLSWNYEQGFVDGSMSQFINSTLTR